MNNPWEFLTSFAQVRPIFLIMPIGMYFLIEYIRRYKRYYYTPIYFPFALESLNPSISLYYGGNIMTHDMASDEDIGDLRKKIWIKSAVSFLLSGILIPFFVGWVSACLLKPDEFHLAFLVIVLVRLESILRSIKDYDMYSSSFRNQRNIAAYVSFGYFLFMLFFLLKGYEDNFSFVAKNDWWGYFKSFFESILVNIALQGIIVAVIAGFLTQMVLDKNAREERKNVLSKTYFDDTELP